MDFNVNLKEKGVASVDIILSINRKGEISAKVTDRETNTSEKIEICRPKQFKEEHIVKMKNELDMIIKMEDTNDTKPRPTKKIKRVALSFDECQQYNVYYSCVEESEDELLLGGF